MAAGQDARQNTVAGLFVLAGILLAAGTLVVIQRISLAKQATYTVRFEVDEGVTGLAPGSPVLVGGLASGSVTSVVPKPGDDGQLRFIDVQISLKADIEIFSNARVVRTMPLLGSQGSLNFTSLGGPGPKVAPEPLRVEPGQTIDAQSSPGMLEMLVGRENSEELGSVITNLASLSELLGEQLPRDYDEFVQPALRDLGGVAHDLSQRWPQWSGRVDTTLANAEDASKSLVDGLSEARELLAAARRPVDDLASMIEQNTPRVDSILANALTVSEDAVAVLGDLRNRSMPMLDEILGKADDALTRIARTVERIEPEVFRQLPQIREILTNIRVASAELKLATIEVRRNPWRLLLSPSSSQVAHENLMDAARAFSIAAGDLKTAGQSFEEILANDPSAFGADPQLAESIRRNLLDELGRFQKARDSLFRTIIEGR